MIKFGALSVLLGSSLLAATLSAQEPPRPTLRSVHKIFVDPMAHDLDKYIKEEIVNQMKDRVVVVVDKDSADAILTGVDEEEKGEGSKITGRYLGLHDVARGTLSLLDKDGKILLWSDDAGDQSLMFTEIGRAHV